jgi:hypothetical protein
LVCRVNLIVSALSMARVSSGTWIMLQSDAGRIGGAVHDFRTGAVELVAGLH